MIFGRYTCPHCGGGLSRTLLGDKPTPAKKERPVFQLPLLPLLGGIVLAGLGLSLIHPGIGVLATAAIGQWINWRYFTWLQCDACSRCLVSGQLGPYPRRTRPWSRDEVRRVGRRVVGCLAILLVVLGPIWFVERMTQANCDATCGAAGRTGEAFLYKCKCVTVKK